MLQRLIALWFCTCAVLILPGLQCSTAAVQHLCVADKHVAGTDMWISQAKGTGHTFTKQHGDADLQHRASAVSAARWHLGHTSLQS